MLTFRTERVTVLSMDLNFTVRQNAHGAWLVVFGEALIRAKSSKREATKVAARLNKSGDCLALAREVALGSEAGAKLWHLAAGAIVSAKSGEPSAVERAAKDLWERAKEVGE